MECIVRLHALHMLSTPCVCALVGGSTKWSEWCCLLLLLEHCRLPTRRCRRLFPTGHAAQLWGAMLQHSSEQLLRESNLRPLSPFLRRRSALPQLVLYCTSAFQICPARSFWPRILGKVMFLAKNLGQDLVQDH